MIGNNMNSQIQTIMVDLLLKLLERQVSSSPTVSQMSCVAMDAEKGSSISGGSFSDLINKAAKNMA